MGGGGGGSDQGAAQQHEGRIDANGGGSNFTRPNNFIFLLTDDQDILLGQSTSYTYPMGSLAIQPAVQQILINGGAAYRNFFINTPICCPSRAQFFSGRYQHNLQVKDESSPSTCMNADTTLITTRYGGLFGVLASHGYNTGVFGKVTNNQNWVLNEGAKTGAMGYIDSPFNPDDYTGRSFIRRNVTGGPVFTETLHETRPEFGTTYQTAQLGNRTLRWLDLSPRTTGRKASPSSPTSARTRRISPRSPRPGTREPSPRSSPQSRQTTTAGTRGRRPTSRRTRRSTTASSAGRTATSATGGLLSSPLTTWCTTSMRS